MKKFVRQEPLSYVLELKWIHSALLKIHKRWGWRKLRQLLREVTLLGDHDIHPYKNAKIESRVISPNEVYPLSAYLLSGKLAIHKCLYHRFLGERKIDVFDLRGGFQFSVDGGVNKFVFGPPIVEVSKVDKDKPLLLDGLHRIYLARKLKKKVRVVWLSKIPLELPIIAKPLRWPNIKMYGKVPVAKKMRKYRWQTFKEFCQDNNFAKATPENYRYFLYRDVSEINSTWHRLSGDRC